MKVTTIKYTRTFNVAAYEKEEYTVEAVINEDGKDDTVQAIKRLKDDVYAAHTGNVEAPFVPNIDPFPGPIDAPKERYNGDDKVVEPKVSEGDDQSSDRDVASGDSQRREEIKEPPKKRGRPKKIVEEKAQAEVEQEKPEEQAPTKKAFRKKPTVYSRANDTHKKIFQGLLNRCVPKWRETDASKAKAKEASINMDGMEFLNDDGSVIQEFESQLRGVFQ